MLVGSVDYKSSNSITGVDGLINDVVSQNLTPLLVRCVAHPFRFAIKPCSYKWSATFLQVDVFGIISVIEPHPILPSSSLQKYNSCSSLSHTLLVIIPFILD